MSDPKRIQLRRTKGWRMPENTVKVARPTKWGNPYRVGHTNFAEQGDGRMNDYTPTTQEVRTSYGAAVTFPTMSLPERRRAFDRWLEQVKAEAWDEGFAVGVNHDLGDWEHPPEVINNPYRQEQD